MCPSLSVSDGLLVVLLQPFLRKNAAVAHYNSPPAWVQFSYSGWISWFVVRVFPQVRRATPPPQ